MDYLRAMAGITSGAGAIMLIYLGYSEAGTGILGLIAGYFVGETTKSVEMKKKYG